MKRTAFVGLLAAAMAPLASAAPTATTQHGPESTSLNSFISTNDLIAGLIATELTGDNGWHPATPGEPERLVAFTDGLGISGGGLTGLLNDFPGAGNPTKLVQYDLGGAKDIARIQILTGNNGKDGRVYSTTVVKTSTNNGGSFSTLGYFQSDPSGSNNNAQSIGSTLVSITDNGGGALATGVTNVIFELYAVSNTGKQMQDPFDGVNPFTNVDDGLGAAFESPLVFELDVIAVPEPASLAMGGLALAALAAARRRQ